jgi:hypothetical protein
VDEMLNKIDILRERMEISYREAKEYLDETGGDLVQALIRAEECGARCWSKTIAEKGDEFKNHVSTYISKGNKTKVRIKRDDKTLAEFPATIGVLGIIGTLASTQLAVIAGIGVAAAAVNRVSLEIEKPEEESKV